MEGSLAGSTQTQQAAVKRNQAIGNNRRRGCPEIAPGRENGRYRLLGLAIGFLEECRDEVTEPRELAATIRFRSDDALVERQRGVTGFPLFQRHQS